MIEKFASILCDPRLLMDASGDVKIYYAPFEYINPSARIVLVGITPGPTQMVNANNSARSVASRCGSTSSISSTIGAFTSGSAWAIRPTCSPLGADHLPPVLSSVRQGRRLPWLTGHMTKHPLLRRYLLENFAAEVEELMKDALFVGLGPQVQKVLDRLIQERVLNSEQVIGGMLHPSPNLHLPDQLPHRRQKRAGPARHQSYALRPRLASVSGALRQRLIEGRVSRCGPGFNSVNGNRTNVFLHFHGG